VLNVQIEKSIEAEVALATVLRKFADRATGHGQTSADDIKALREMANRLSSRLVPFSAQKKFTDKVIAAQ
jgi:hypothetical protein